MNFIDRNVSVEKAVIILAKNGVQVNDINYPYKLIKQDAAG